MPNKKITARHTSARGFSSQMADEINRQQATKSHRKEVAKKFHASKPKQGYTPQRSGVDISTL